MQKSIFNAIFVVEKISGGECMPYEVLEKQIKSLPAEYYNELVDYLEFLIKKSEKKSAPSEEESLKKMRDAGVSTVWETLKNDTW